MRFAALPFAVVTMLFSSCLAQSAAGPAAQWLFQTTNQHRAEHGLPPLAWDGALAHAAQAHAERMSREPGESQHQYPGEPNLTARAMQAGAHFSKVSENIAEATASVADIDRAWMNSPVHRANILDLQLNTIGISVIEVRGTLHAVEDFGHSNPTLGRDEIESRAQQALREQGIRVQTSDAATQAARKNCESPNSAPAPGVLLAMQWDGPDLTQLPATVLQGMPQVNQHSVAVGSCPSTRGGEGFTTYHLAVLMY